MTTPRAGRREPAVGPRRLPPAERTLAARLEWLAAGLGAGVGPALLTWLLGGRGRVMSEWDSRFVVVLIGCAAVAAAGCGWRAGRSRSRWRGRASWLSLALALGLAAGAVLAEAGRAPVPGLDDGLPVAALAVLSVGLATLPGAGRLDRGWRLLLDAAGTACAVVAVAGGPLFGSVDELGDRALVAGAHLLVATAGAVAAFAVLTGMRPRPGGSDGLHVGPGDREAVAAATLCAVVGDGWSTAHRMAGAAPVARYGEIGWLVAVLLVGVGALVAPRLAGRAAPVSRDRLAALGLVVPGLVSLALLGVRLLQGGEPDLVEVGALFALAAVVLARLAMTRMDALAMTRTLEGRVAERTLALVSREQWFRSLVQNSSDVLTVVDENGVVRYQSPAVQRVFGHDPAGLVGRPITYLLRSTDARRLEQALAEAAQRPRSTLTLEFAVWHKEGRWCETESSVVSLLDDQDIRGLVLTTRDVGERKQLEQALTHQAFHDNLTGLPNRVLFQERVVQALQYAAGADRVGVLFLDLDGFKAVNDTQGHALGDQLLGLVAERLRHCVRPSDTVARLGGDEFAVLVTGEECARAVVWVAERIREAVAQPFVLDGRDIAIGVSTGIALNAQPGDTADVLLRNADVAMYKAKARREGGWVRFESGMRDALLDRVEMESDLKLALSRGQLITYFQPTVELTGGHVIGAEALLRWHHPTRGIVGPDEFIGLAEEVGLISAVGDWVLHQTCRVGARWQRWAPPNGYFHVAVNLSPRQVVPGLVESVRSALTTSGLPAGALVLEITESVLVDRTDEVLALLHELKKLGVRLAIDDFVTGYSSLSYLSRFPVDVLKMDKTFVEAVASPGERAELAKTIIQLGAGLQLETVAEGIETQGQYAALRAMGCDYGQGYLFARPLPASGVDELLGCRVLASGHAASA